MTQRYAGDSIAKRFTDNPGAVDVAKADPYKATRSTLRIITLDPGKAAIPAGFLAAGSAGYGVGHRRGRRTVAAKGLFKQSVKPTLARVRPNASAKPTRSFESTKPYDLAQGVRYLGPGDVGGRGVRKGLVSDGLEGLKAFKGNISRGVEGLSKPKVPLGAAKSTVAAGRAGAWLGANRAPVTALGAVGGGSYLAGKHVGKADRHYDPEKARSFNRGAGAAALGLGGTAATVGGARGIVRDTREARSTVRSVPMPRNAPQPRKAKQQTRGADGKMRSLTDAERAAEQARFAHETEQFHSVGQAQHALGRMQGASSHLFSIKGRQAAAVTGGLAAVTGAGRLARHRHEERWT